MTKKAYAVLLILIATTCITAAQDSPTPASSPAATETPVATAARSVRISFVPPPMEGTISLGIFDANKKLVRVLRREAKTDSFTIEETSLTTNWDGKNDRGEDLPPGKYHARGYMVGSLKIEEISPAPSSPIDAPVSDHISVRLTINPLLADVRSAMELGASFDPNGSFLRTMDDLPLFTVSTTPNIVRVSITKAGEKSAMLLEEDGSATKQFRVSNIDKMMAFDCGDVELR